jgi:hypothetical protein
MHFSFLIYSNNHPVHVSNRLTIHHQEAVTVYAAIAVYHAENITVTYVKLHVHIVTTAFMNLSIIHYNFSPTCFFHSCEEYQGKFDILLTLYHFVSQ